MALAVLAAHDLARLGDPVAAAPRLTRLAGQVLGALGAACAEHTRAATRLDPSAVTPLLQIAEAKLEVLESANGGVVARAA